MAIKDWSTTAGSNTSSPPDGAPEGWAPSAVNNTIREIMAQVRGFYEDPAWINYGYTYTYVSTTQFKISGSDQTAKYPVGRRVRAVGTTTGTIYGTITTSSFSTDTTITVTWDSGTLSNETLQISAGIPSLGKPYTYAQLAGTSGSIPLSDMANLAASTVIGRAEGAGTGVPVALTATQIQAIAAVSLQQDFRLTLTSSVPVTTTDVTGATTIYCTPYKGNRIALYSGSTGWTVLKSAEFSVALGTLTNDLMYDVFCYNNSGTPTLELLSWTNNTTRATGLTRQDGVLVKSGDATRRYMGSFCTTSTTTTADSRANRFLWNYYNRVRRYMFAEDTTTTWTYSTATYRQARASTSNQLNFVIGVAEDAVQAQVGTIQVFNSAASIAYVGVGIGLDSTSANSAAKSGGQACFNSYAAYPTSDYCDVVSAGKHYLAWLEKGHGSSTQTWYSGGASGYGGAGIVGNLMA